MSFEECLPSLGCHSILIRVVPPFFLRVDCEDNRPSFFATVFDGASVFNGNLNQWDVAKVTTMYASKSIHIVENDLT
jgi:hypothetical protein